MTTIVLKNSLIDDAFQAVWDEISVMLLLLNLPQNRGRWSSTNGIFSACQLCNLFGCFYYYSCKKAPWIEPKVFVLVHAYGQIFGFYWAPSQRPALHFYHLDKRWWAHLLLHHHIIHHFGSIYTFRFPPSDHALCSLATKRAKEEFQRVCNVSMWLCPHRVFNSDSRLPSFGGIAAVAAGGGGNGRCHRCIASQGLSNMGH